MPTSLLLGEVEYKKLEELLTDSATSADGLRHTRLYDGDHWLNGDGWLGPKPNMSSPFGADLLERIRQGFVSKNIVKEVVDRKRDSILGTQPDWSFTVRRHRKKIKRQIPVPDPGEESGFRMVDDPRGSMVAEPLTPQEQELIDEVNAAALTWWQKRKPLKALQDAFRRRLITGRGYVRLYMPRSRTAGGQRPTFPTLLEALDAIFVESPESDNAVMAKDAWTEEAVSVVRLSRDKDKGEVPAVEMCYLDENRETVVVVIAESQDAQAGDPGARTQPTTGKQLGDGGEGGGTEDDFARRAAPLSPFPGETGRSNPPLKLGGHLTTWETEGAPLVTPQIVQNNMLVNEALTMAGQGVWDAGFTEVTWTNIEIAGKEVDDGQGGTTLIPDTVPRGGGIVHQLVGVQTQNPETGAVTVATPGVHYKEPSPVTAFSDTKTLGYVTCLEEAHQLHAAMAGDATASGVSRIQALADFVMNSLDDKDDCDDMGIWLLEAATLFAASFVAGMTDRVLTLRATFDCKLFVGQITPEERTAVINEVKARLRGRRSAQILLQIQDPDAENADIMMDEALVVQPLQKEQGRGGGTDNKPATASGIPENLPKPSPKPRELEAPTA